MTTEFLKELGITDQSTIDAIFAENGKDVNKAKGNVESLNTQITDLKSQLSDRDNQLSELKKSNKDNEALTAKIAQMEENNKKVEQDYTNRIATIEKSHAIENGLRDAKAKNIKAVSALLNMDKIVYNSDGLTGLDEQIKTLKESEDTSFLFENEGSHQLSGANVNNPDLNGQNIKDVTSVTLAGAIAKALK